MSVATLVRNPNTNALQTCYVRGELDSNSNSNSDPEPKHNPNGSLSLSLSMILTLRRFAMKGEAKNREYAETIIMETHQYWQA